MLVVGLPTVLASDANVRQGMTLWQERVSNLALSLREGLMSRVFWILAAVLFCSSIAQNGAIAHMAALLTDRGVSASGAALAVSAMGGASLAGRLLTGWLLDRFFAARVSIALLAVAALGTFLLSGAQSLAMGVVAAVMIGIGMGGEADVTLYILSRYFGLRSFLARTASLGRPMHAQGHSVRFSWAKRST